MDTRAGEAICSALLSLAVPSRRVVGRGASTATTVGRVEERSDTGKEQSTRREWAGAATMDSASAALASSPQPSLPLVQRCTHAPLHDSRCDPEIALRCA